MKQILIFIFFLALFSCQPKQLADVLVKDYSVGSIQSKGTEDFAIYGWFFIRSNIDYGVHPISLVQYFPNTDKKAKENFFLNFDENNFSLEFFRVPKATTTNGMIHKEVDLTTVSNQDLNQWTFIHLSYSRSLRKVFAYFKFPSGDKTKSFEIDLGDAAYGSYTSGSTQFDARNIYFVSGQGSYRESNFKDLMGDPTTFYDCTIAYQRCNLEGEGKRLCGEKISLEFLSFYSLYIPNGKSVLVYQDTAMGRQEKIYTKNIYCVRSDLKNLSLLKKQSKAKINKTKLN